MKDVEAGNFVKTTEEYEEKHGTKMNGLFSSRHEVGYILVVMVSALRGAMRRSEIMTVEMLASIYELF